jgi:hypothetical protein
MLPEGIDVDASLSGGVAHSLNAAHDNDSSRNLFDDVGISEITSDP